MIALRAAAVTVGLSLVLHGAAAAQLPVASGDSVRIRLTAEHQAAWPAFWISGSVTAADADSLWMRVQRPAVTSGFAAADIVRLQVHRGVAPFGRGKGLLIGAAAGATLGAVAEAIRVQGATSSSADEAWAPVSITLVGAAGAVVGGTAGWLFGRRPIAVWETVPVPVAPSP